MNAIQLLKKYVGEKNETRFLLMVHSAIVASCALSIARKNPGLHADKDFLYEAAMLHDIGIIYVNAPDIGCYGKHPYIMHGILGAEIMIKEGFPKHARVCETHVGAGITADEIRKSGLPLPEKDYLPVSIEEKIICVADKFYSKSPDKICHVRSIAEAEKMISHYGNEGLHRFREMCDLLNLITRPC
ncbi:MAG: HD domain-containing protein [Bacteroidota bacterium]